jgi:hypothetical protein
MARKLPALGIVGTVQNAIAVMTKKKMATTMNDARQLEYLVATPEDMLPSTKPRGLPQPSAPVTMFLLRPGGYVVKSIPTAGGAMAAVPRPRKPSRTFKAMPFGAKEVTRAKRLRKARPASS